MWSAPDRAASVTVKLTIGALSDTKTVTVVEPTSITATKVGSDMTFPGGTQSGMKLRFKYHPLNVSFGNIFVKEVSGPATNFSGYFPHPPNNQHWHNSGDVFTRIREDNTDSAIDTASFRGYPSPWTDGGFEWVIPNNFRTVTEAGDGKQFTTVTQVFKIEGPPNAGRSTVSKAGRSAPRSP